MFRAFSLAAAGAAFLLAVLGSWVRINGAGMTCPDWPLCHGRLVPALEGGVILEWGHRMVAFLVGFLVLGALLAAWRERDRVAGIRPVMIAIGAVFVLQVLLGGITVFVANSPWSVVLHWAAAMLFIAALSALAILAAVRPRTIAIRHSVLGGALTVAAVLAFTVMCAGAYVSSSNAGLSCTTLPLCNGSVLGETAWQSAQMIHRLLAGVFFLVATYCAYAAAFGTTARVRVATLFGFALIVLQVMLGFANVAWSMPMVLREAHAANAAATFLAFVAAVVFAALDGTAPQPARATPPSVLSLSKDS